MARVTAFDYEDSTWLTLGLIGLLAAFVVLAEVGIWSSFLELDLWRRTLERGHFYPAELAADERRRALVGGLQILLFVVSAALFLRWLHRMSRNVRALAATGLRHGPGGAVGWFFVPGVHLRKPLTVVTELFRASHPEFIDDWRQAPVPHLLTLWWTLWVLFQVTVGLALLTDLWARSPQELLVAAWGTAVVGVVAAPLGVATAICAWRLHARQRARFRVTAPLRERKPWPTRTSEEPEPAA